MHFIWTVERNLHWSEIAYMALALRKDSKSYKMPIEEFQTLNLRAGIHSGRIISLYFMTNPEALLKVNIHISGSVKI